ncbi:uncharacterized protein LOC130898458 [Diorhabda carinulata]|uniref:uncharacterized protein LOC130898458 n=1 Tax=Diorhabda carinulata TaxID=1163345 RepID=UPI00259FFA6B|nr:uncharacterized protein LOC130898458 [Diorhabda carinulata]
MCCQSNAKGIFIAIWTIIQTSFHIVFVLGGYYICQFKPAHYLVFVLYITYFYDYDKCGSLSVSPENYSFPKTLKGESKLADLRRNSTENEDDLYKIIDTIMEQANFPRQTYPYFRTRTYIFLYAVHDCCWIMSSFLLFVGICFQVKKCLSVLFYGPWLLSCGIGLLLDVVAAVHFGLDMLYIHNYTSWLNFIGVENYKDFRKFDNYYSSNFVPFASSVIMVAFFSRLLAFWALNIVTFFSINSHFVMAYVDSDSSSKQSSNRRTKNAIDSSELRIRNWQMFYGTVDTSSRDSSIHSDKDYDSSKGGISLMMSATRRKHSDNNSPRPVAGNSTTRYSIDSNIEYLSGTNSSPNVTSSYIRFPDVVDSMDNKSRKYSSDSIRREVPWSYLRYNEKFATYGESSKTDSKEKEVRIFNEITGSQFF